MPDIFLHPCIVLHKNRNRTIFWKKINKTECQSSQVNYHLANSKFSLVKTLRRFKKKGYN